MFLALKEIRRAKVRFGLLMAAIGLLVFLILVQVTLQNGLLSAFVGAIENQNAPVLVYSVDGQRSVQGSIITPDVEGSVRQADGVAAVGRIGQGTFSVIAGEAVNTATIFGYEDPNLGAPTTLTDGRLPASVGEAVAWDDSGAGFAIGDVVRTAPGDYEIEIVGLASDVSLFATPTLFTTFATYEAAVRATNPDAPFVLPNVLGVSPATGFDAEQVVQNINAASPEADALTREEAVRETPGVAQVRQSFLLIFLLYALVVPFVTGLFFLIVTFQKAQALTLLRAIGAPARRLVGALIFQVVVVMALGIAIGTIFYYPLSQQTVGSIPLRFETNAVVFWAVLLLALGVVSAFFSASRVLRIDPAAATTGSGVGR